VARYRAWLAERDLPVNDPPRGRPAPGEDPAPWVRWRLFCMERMTDFLCDMSDQARAGYAAPETLTCHMGCPVMPGAAVRGEDYFGTAARMDVLGMTAYTPNRGPSYHQASLALTCCESAAATFGKHAWLIEYNARTDMPPQEWLRETCAAVGHGFKGILYYQWRADYPFADGPEPEGFGMLYNNGERTPFFDTAVAMNRVVNRLSEAIAVCEKRRVGVGVLYSSHANAYYDALDNGNILSVSQGRERSILALRRLYTLLNAAGVPADFTRAQDLHANPLGIAVLLLPCADGLSPEELDAVDAFAAQGGKVYRYLDAALGFAPYVRDQQSVLHGIVTQEYDLDSLLALEAVVPPATVLGAPCVDARMLQGPGHAICCLTHYDPLERPVERAVLRVNDLAYARATAFAVGLPEEGLPLRVDGDRVELPRFSYGAFVLFQ
jgi:hypothetical protein